MIDRQLDIKSPWIAKDPSVSDLQNLLNSLHNHMAQQPPSSQSSPPLSAPNAPPSQTPSVVPETQIGDSSSMNAIQSALAGIVPGTPNQNLLPLSEHSPSSSLASTTGGADLHNTVAQLLQGGNNSVIGALLKGFSGDESQGTDGRKKWPCRSCKQTGHTWARCPQLNVINVIVSLIMSKQEQVNTETNLKRVSDTLLQLGLSPATLGVGNQRDKADNSRNGAAAALAAALTNSLGGTQQGLSHHLAPPLAPVPQPLAISPTQGQSSSSDNPAAGNLQSLFTSLGIAHAPPAQTIQSRTGIFNSIAQNSSCSSTAPNALLMALGISPQTPHVPHAPNPLPAHTPPGNTSPVSQPHMTDQPPPQSRVGLGTDGGGERAAPQPQLPQPDPRPACTDSSAADDARAKAAEAAIRRLLNEQRKDCPPGPPTVPEFFAVPKPLARPQGTAAAHAGAGSTHRSAISVDSDAMEDDRENAIPKRTRNDRTPASQKQATINVDETSTPASKRATNSLPDSASEPATPVNLARALESEMAQSAPATNAHVQALERQLAEYKKLLEDYMSSGAPKPAAKKAPKPGAKKVHEAGTLSMDLPARQILTKSVRNPQEGASVFAIKPALSKSSYLYIRGIVDRVEGSYVYIKVVPDIAVEGTCNDPVLEVFDKNWIFGLETFVNEAIVRLNELLNTPSPSGPN